MIEITQAFEQSRGHPSEDVTEGAAHDPAPGADTGHSHTGGLLFVHESEIDPPAVSDVPPAVDDVPPAVDDAPLTVDDVPPAVDDFISMDEVVSYEETIQEQQPTEVPEPVGPSTSLTGKPIDIISHDQTQPSGPIDWSSEVEHELPPISGLQESFGGEAQPATTVVEEQAPPEDGGFTTHGGRGRGPRGERRGGRGGYRGEGGRGGYGRGGHYGDRGGRGCKRFRGVW